MSLFRSAAVSSALLVTAAHAFASDKYDFGNPLTLTRKTVTLERRLAPEVQLQNTSIDVRFPAGPGGMDGAKFKAKLTSDIIESAPTLRLDEQKPDYEIRVTVLSYEAPHFETKTEGKNTTKTPVGGGTVSFVLVHRVDGMAVLSRTESFKMSEAATMSVTPASSGSVWDRMKTAGSSAVSRGNTDESLRLELIQGLAQRVASHLVITPEMIVVPLSHGPELNDVTKLATAKRWEEFLEKVSAIAPFPAKDDDAYRLYDIGLANEALGYTSDDPKVSLKFFREASINYSHALEAKGAEKFFLASQGRIEQALQRYDQLAERAKQTEAMHAADAKVTADTAARRKAGEIANADVIALWQAKVAPNIIAMKIRTAPSVDFDLGVDGLINLSKAGVPENLIQAMTERSQGKPVTPVAAAPPAAPAPDPPATQRKTRRQ